MGIDGGTKEQTVYYKDSLTVPSILGVKVLIKLQHQSPDQPKIK